MNIDNHSLCIEVHLFLERTQTILKGTESTLQGILKDSNPRNWQLLGFDVIYRRVWFQTLSAIELVFRTWNTHWSYDSNVL